jgi:UDP-2-acetamido-2-deoxy-ribo-hexuluronate aminotransferase
MSSEGRPIQMVDLVGQYEQIKVELDEALRRIFYTSAYINGPEVGEFARELAEFTHSKHVIPCANGTDALQIALMSLQLQPGDEVLVPSFTFVSSAEVIALLGMVPVFVDVDPGTFNIDLESAKEKITAKTRAIIPVHLFGQCAEISGVMNLAANYNLQVIEDNAQSLGAVYQGPDGSIRQAGTIGDLGTTSFFPSKILGAYGDGGAIFCQDDALAETCRIIANHGSRKKYFHEMVGVNSRLDTLQAAILRVKLKYLGQYISHRQKAAATYDLRLAGCPDVRIPRRSTFSTHVFHQYTLKVQRRDELKSFLASKGIPSMVYYPQPLHLQPAFRGGAQDAALVVSEGLCREVLSLPMHTELRTDEISAIVEQILKFYNSQ